MRKLLIATHNPGKRKEYSEILQGVPFELVTLDDVGIKEDVKETGKTFEENARLKAVTYAQQSGLLTLADDSGLEVDALGGAPGIYSKRYLGEDKTDGERNAHLLAQLRAVPPEKRTARFRCVIVIADAKGNEWVSEGVCEGAIGMEPRGTNGFGYDPVFLLPERGKHFAELSSEEKNKISHRGRAAEGARKILEKIQFTVDDPPA